MFDPVLHTVRIDQSKSDEEQLEAFFKSDEEYLALTQGEHYEAMISRMATLEEFVRSVLMQADN
jgi:hypothetical protein